MLLVDGLNFVRRIWAAVPGAPEDAGHLEAACRSVEGSLARALAEIAPTHAACVLDGDGPGWRRRLHPGYKPGGPSMPDALRAGFADVAAAVDACGVRRLAVPEFEADDVLATLAVGVAARGGEAVVLSTDRALCQIVGERVRVRDHFAQRDLGARHVRERFGVEPRDLATALALAGDRAAGIPGVAGIGRRTAAALVSEHGDLESILAAAGTIGGRAGRALGAAADDARLSLELVRLRTDVKVDVNLRDLRVGAR